MISLIQRVAHAHVTVAGETVGAIDRGLLVLVGFAQGDDETALTLPVHKLPRLRVFPDTTGKMNGSVQDIGGGLLVVSQFTLAGDCRKGLRPSFDDALPPAHAQALYDKLIARLRAESGCPVATGVFGASMAVHLVNDGPVTLLLSS